MIKGITNTFLINRGFKLINGDYILVLYSETNDNLKQNRELILTKKIETKSNTINYVYEVELRSSIYYEEELQEESQRIFLNDIQGKNRLMMLIKVLK